MRFDNSVFCFVVVGGVCFVLFCFLLLFCIVAFFRVFFFAVFVSFCFSFY